MIPWGSINLAVALPAFMLVAARVSGVFLAAPVLGSLMIPARIKAAAVLAMSATIFPVVWAALPADLSPVAVITGLTGELLIGLLLGLGLELVLLAAHTAGMIVGQQAGLSLGAVFNPHADIESTTIGEVFSLTATVVFLTIGGHRELIRALLDSFASVPVMSFAAGQDVVAVLIALSQDSLKLALRIAGPAVVALLVAKAGLGLLSRTMPQLHILSVGFAVLVSIGLIMCGLIMGGYDQLLAASLSEALAQLRVVLGIN